jgi:predicted GNAT family N-acyltransferase
MRVVEATTAAERADAFAVRKAVFVEEQGVDPDLEYDEHDEAATHFVAYGDGPVGAARLRASDPGVGKVERVAVLADHRGEGVGRAVMTAVHDAARERGFGELYLHAQTRVAGFYERLGYEVEGGEFEEAGIPHVAMRRGLSS